MRILRSTLIIIGIFQLVLGLVFTVAPAATNDLFRLVGDEPAWVDWLFIMMGARFLGFAYGMFRAAGAPEAHVGWINAMIGVQTVDWLATVGFVATGALTLGQVTTAAIVPPVFVALMVWFHPNRLRRSLGTNPV